jgi:FHA domain/Bacterial PH domain
MTKIKLTVTHLTGLRQGEVEIFATFPLTIGRAPYSLLRLAANDTRASARHAEVHPDTNGLLLLDLGSTNGTFINGQKIERVKLVNGDVVEFGAGGPQLKFEFASELAIQPATAIAVPHNPLPITELPAELKIHDTPRLVSGTLLTIEEREFPFRNRFKYALAGAGLSLIIAAIALLVNQILLWAIPTLLVGLFLLLMGWSYSRINITINNRGILYQGILRSTMIRWEEVQELRTTRSRTRLLTDLVYVVYGPRHSVAFAVEEYADGLELTDLIKRYTGKSW